MTLDPVDESWRDRFEAKIERLIDDKHKRVNIRVDDCERAHEKLAENIQERYVSKESLRYQLDGINNRLEDRYGPILTALKWVIGIVCGGFLGGLVHYVYTHNS